MTVTVVVVLIPTLILPHLLTRAPTTCSAQPQLPTTVTPLTVLNHMPIVSPLPTLAETSYITHPQTTLPAPLLVVIIHLFKPPPPLIPTPIPLTKQSQHLLVSLVLLFPLLSISLSITNQSTLYLQTQNMTRNAPLLPSLLGSIHLMPIHPHNSMPLPTLALTPALTTMRALKHGSSLTRT